MKKIAILILALLSLAACKKEGPGNPTGLFRPYLSDTNVIVDGNTISVKWQRCIHQESFELIITEAQAAPEGDIWSNTVNTDEANYKFTGLKYSTQYIIKVRALNKTLGISSAYGQFSKITTEEKPE